MAPKRMFVKYSASAGGASTNNSQLITSDSEHYRGLWAAAQPRAEQRMRRPVLTKAQVVGSHLTQLDRGVEPAG